MFTISGNLPLAMVKPPKALMDSPASADLVRVMETRRTRVGLERYFIGTLSAPHRYFRYFSGSNAGLQRQELYGAILSRMKHRCHSAPLFPARRAVVAKSFQRQRPKSLVNPRPGRSYSVRDRLGQGARLEQDKRQEQQVKNRSSDAALRLTPRRTTPHRPPQALIPSVRRS